MSTRRVQPGERRRQNGWASAPEYDVLHGLNGTAVAFKAALQDDPQKREILFCLQAMSLRDGGVNRIARELVDMFPERIGTPTMHKIGCRPGKKLTAGQYQTIRAELLERDDWSDDWDAILDRPARKETKVEPPPNAAAALCAECGQEARSLGAFIEEICCNPKIELVRDGESKGSYRATVEVVIEDARGQLDENPKFARERPDLETATRKDNQFRTADVPYFHDLLGALLEYKRRHEENARADYVETSIGKIVFEALDYALETGRSALLEGKSGFGKTTALKAWVNMHLGQARYVQLSGITSRTAFLRRIADACGVAHGGGLSTDRIQSRVENFLKRAKLILIIDEGQYLWPQHRRITSHPELVNWLNTACYNEGVPFVISATEQYTKRRQAVEAQTDWSSEQSRRRTRRVFRLPDEPTEQDLESVARKLLAHLGDNANAVDLAVGYALTSRGYFQSIVDAIDDARLIAKRDGRDKATFKDLKAAIYEWRAPSDAALQRVFDTKPETTRRRRLVAPGAPPIETQFEGRENEPLTDVFEPVKDRLRGAPAALRTTRPELVAVGDG